MLRDSSAQTRGCPATSPSPGGLLVLGRRGWARRGGFMGAMPVAGWAAASPYTHLCPSCALPLELTLHLS